MSIVKYNGKVVRSASGKWIGTSAAPQHGAVIGGKTYPTVSPSRERRIERRS